MLIRILIDQGNSERTIETAVARLPHVGQALDLPGGGSCIVTRVDEIADSLDGIEAFVIATLNR